MNTKKNQDFFLLRPRPYEFVGMAVGESEGGFLLHRSVSALQVPGGFVVHLYEYVSDATPSQLPQPPPSPGHFTTIFLPVKSLDEVRGVFFIEGEHTSEPR